MSTTIAEASLRTPRIALQKIKALLAATFFLVGGMRIYGLPVLVPEIEHLGFGQWFYYAIGLLEIASALVILTPRLPAIGAALLSCIMVGAVAADVFLIGGAAWLAIAFFLLSSIVLLAQRKDDGAVTNEPRGDAPARKFRAF